MAELTKIQQDLRSGLRRLAKAVVIITCRHDGQRYAMAATAVSELSMEPPSMLVCVNKTASISPVLTAGADFAINILDGGHKAIADACSGAIKGEARFQVGSWQEGGTGIPVLADAQASFQCRNVNRFSHGTHDIFIGEVFDTRTAGDVNPLVYVDGRYTLTAKDSVAS